jgi:hypothetical protein
MDKVRKADDDWSSGILFSSTVGVATRQVVLCLNWCASPGQPESTTSGRLDQTGHVEYWKAQCGESRMLRLGGGKERKLLPIRTKGLAEIPPVVDRQVEASSSTSPAPYPTICSHLVSFTTRR